MAGAAGLCWVVAETAVCAGSWQALLGHAWTWRALVEMVRGGQSWVMSARECVLLARSVYWCVVLARVGNCCGRSGSWPIQETCWLVARTAGSFQLVVGTAVLCWLPAVNAGLY